MITGTISADLEPILHDVFVRLPEGTLHPVKTVLDTGFNGSFCLPKNILEQMGLEAATTQTFELADGRYIVEDTFFGEVIINHRPFVVELSGTDSDTALMGMAMLLEKEAIFNLKDMTVKAI
jgi:clan AA aspartic protease